MSKLRLTPKEAQVLNLVYRGMSVKSAAKHLGLTIEAAHNRLRTAYRNNSLAPYSEISLVTLLLRYIDDLYR